MDYPLTGDVYELLDQVQSKTISFDFDEQLEAAEELYGQQIKFHFTKQEVDAIINEAVLYGNLERERIKMIIYHQMRKYLYLFS